MGLEGGQDKGGQLVWKRDDDTIVPVRILIDTDGSVVPVPTGPGATEAKQDDIITRMGDVGTTPALNTQLRRLKDLLSLIVLADGSNIIGATRSVDPNNDSRFGEYDNIFTIPVGINVGHYQIHEGFSYERHIDSANALVAGLNIAFKTLPGTKLAHILFGWSSSDEILFEILEGATWTQGSGTALPLSNLNRNAGNSTVILEDKNQPTFTASNQIIKDVTNIAGGTTFENQYTYNASLGASVIAESRQAAHEWVLKPDTTYVVRMTETDDNCKMSITLHWYEKTPE